MSLNQKKLQIIGVCCLALSAWSCSDKESEPQKAADSAEVEVATEAASAEELTKVQERQAKVLAELQLGCPIPQNAFAYLPTTVITPTGTAYKDDYSVQPGAKYSDINFQATTNGTQISVKLIQGDNSVAAVRKIAVSGQTPESKFYTNLCIEGEKVFRKDLRGILVEGGMLWLEFNPDGGVVNSNDWRFLSSE